MAFGSYHVIWTALSSQGNTCVQFNLRLSRRRFSKHITVGNVHLTLHVQAWERKLQLREVENLAEDAVELHLCLPIVILLFSRVNLTLNLNLKAIAPKPTAVVMLFLSSA
jgi:hypothetical protein